MEWIARCSLAHGPSPPRRTVSKEGKKIREDERRTKEQEQKRKQAMREEGEPRAVRVGGRSGFSGAEGDTEAWSSGYQQLQW